MAREQEGALDYEFDRHIKEAEVRGDEEALHAFINLKRIVDAGIETGILFQLKKEDITLTVQGLEENEVLIPYEPPINRVTPKSTIEQAAHVLRQIKRRKLPWRATLFNS